MTYVGGILSSGATSMKGPSGLSRRLVGVEAMESFKREQVAGSVCVPGWCAQTPEETSGV